jgi:hypothetical protein
MFRKDAFLDCGGYLEEERHAEDFGLWGRLVKRGAVVGIPDPLLHFRVHEGSISKQKLDYQMDLSRRIARRHCREFMKLDEAQADRAYEALLQRSSRSTLVDWFWLLIRCLPRLEKQSLELWAWAAQRTVMRLIRR